MIPKTETFFKIENNKILSKFMKSTLAELPATFLLYQVANHQLVTVAVNVIPFFTQHVQELLYTNININFIIKL